RYAWAPDNPWGMTDEQLEAAVKSREQTWGQGNLIERFMPSLAGDEELRKLFGRTERASASPGAAQVLMRMNHGIDVRHVLATIPGATVRLDRKGESRIKGEDGRYLARHIEGAKYVEFPGKDHAPWVGDANSLIGEIESFLTGQRRE